MAHPRHEAARAAIEDDAAKKAANTMAFSPEAAPASSGQSLMPAPSGVELDPGETYERAEEVAPPQVGREADAMSFDKGITDRTTDELEAARMKLSVQASDGVRGEQDDAYRRLLHRIDRELALRQTQGE